MKKTIEVEYVGIEDVQEIMDDAYAATKEGHFVSISFSNCSENVMISVTVMIDGYESEKNLDYSFTFFMTDKEPDVKEMNECKNVLKNLLVEEQEYETL